MDNQSMCNDCFEDLIYKFDSQEEFDDFQTLLTNKCIRKKLEIIKREETDYWAPFDRYEFYKCNSCGEIWILSVPDKARKGFFLTQHKGTEYIKKLEESKKNRTAGCLVLIILLIIVAILKLTT